MILVGGSVIKSILLIVISIITIPLVLATNPPPNALFEFPTAHCDEDGLVSINISHTGSQVKISNINITATEKENSIVTSLTGRWSTESGWLLENYTPNSLLDRSFLVFKSNVSLPGKGDYTFFMQWQVPRADWQNKLKFAGSCPGKSCSSNPDCASNQHCVDEVCEIVPCPACEKAADHKCTFRCDDSNPTTKDSCDEGICSNVNISGSCRFNSECDDGKQCTEDVCVNNKCGWRPVKCLASIDPCIKGGCEEGAGCVYKSEELCQLRQQALFVRIWNFIRAIFS